MSEEYKSIPSGLCPTCFSDISEDNYDFFDDPLLTSKGLSGDLFKGNMPLSYAHITQLQSYYDKLQRLAGFGYDNGRVRFSGGALWADHYSKNIILELRQVIENILAIMSWNLNQYFNWSKRGIMIRSTLSDWADSLKDITKIRAIHIEQLRQGMLPVWAEFWRDNIDKPIIHDFYGLEGMTSNTRDWKINRGTDIGALSNKIWSFNGNSESYWAYNFAYPRPRSASDTLKLTPKWLSYLPGGTGLLGNNYFPLKIGNRPLAFKFDLQVSNMEAETTWSFYKTDITAPKQYTGNENAYPDSPPEDIIASRCYNEIRVRIGRIDNWWDGEIITYVLSYPIIQEDTRTELYPPRSIPLIKIENFDSPLEIANDCIRLFGINPEEYLIIEWDILIKCESIVDSIGVWGKYHPVYPSLRYVDIWHYKGTASSSATLGKCLIYYIQNGSYISENLSSQIDGEANVFTLSNIPVKAAMILKLDGVELKQGVVGDVKDYFIAGNQVITTNILEEGSLLEVEYLNEG